MILKLGFRMWQVQEFAEQLLKAIDFMHALGLTHTDLKPENILLVNDELKFDEEKVIHDKENKLAHRLQNKGNRFWRCYLQR